MDNSEIVKLAKFVGFFPQDIVSDNGYLGWWSSPTTFPNHNEKQIMFDAMKFHSSYDWLMLVVDKIYTSSKGKYVVKIMGNKTEIIETSTNKLIIKRVGINMFGGLRSAIIRFIESHD